MRTIECKSPDDSLSAKCDPQTKPGSIQQCTMNLSCDGSNPLMGHEVRKSKVATNTMPKVYSKYKLYLNLHIYACNSTL